MRALILGHFSTIGDVESLAYVTEQLQEEGIAYDAMPFNEKLTPYVERGISRADMEPSSYTHLIVVCGPFWPELLVRRGIDLQRFQHCTRIGVNLTMIEPTDDWNPFHLLIERDSDRAVRPDISFLQRPTTRPVVGLCIIERQREYGSLQRHAAAVSMLRELVQVRDLSAVSIDTRWPAHRNSGGLASAAQVSSVIGRMDVLLTNRLHGLVYGLKTGVPVLAIDPVDGGGKVSQQAGILHWPAIARPGAVSQDELSRMLDWCLSADGKSAARRIAEEAREKLRPVGEQFRAALHAEFGFQPVPPTRATARPKRLQRFIRSLRWR